MTTHLDVKHGWLCCKELDKMTTWSVSYRIELGLLRGRQKLTAYQHFQNL